MMSTTALVSAAAAAALPSLEQQAGALLAWKASNPGETCQRHAAALWTLVALELSHDNLPQSIPVNINLLEELRTLLLDDNQIRGSIPPVLADLTKERFLRARKRISTSSTYLWLWRAMRRSSAGCPCEEDVGATASRHDCEDSLTSRRSECAHG